MSQKLRLANQVVKREKNEWIDLYPKLQRYCHFITQNSWDGDDLAHNTYLKALRYTDQMMSLSLLNKIAYHQWIDLLRKRKNEQLDVNLEISGQQRLDRVIYTIEILKEQFTPKQAVIFLLKEGFQFKMKEIAELLGSTEIAVKASFQRAKNRLEKRKIDEEKEISIVESYWDEDEKAVISDLMFEALYEQDPTILIGAIPILESVVDIRHFNSGKLIESSGIKNQITPSSTLCMAA